jgi:predicted kinase
MKLKQHILIMMLGHPGSGKTYFTRQLAPKLNAVRFNGDHMRVAMFKDPRLATRADNPKVFGAIEYAVTEVLKAGHSVVYDAQHNKLEDRKRLEALAAEHGAEAVIVWVKAPREVALQRGIDREELPDQRRKTEEEMNASIDFFMDALETPGLDEKLIQIDGTIPFEEQLKSFQEQLAALRQE